MKTTFICTVFNEEKTIESLLKSLMAQTKKPDEVIVVDGGSSDNTTLIINDFIKVNKFKNFRLIQKKGNRSVGRNEAIRNSGNEIILSSDAGCVLDKNWIKEISKPFKNKDVDSVAGYYKGLSRNAFQEALVPFVLVMEDKLTQDRFLPSTRSMAFRKFVWEKVGGFKEEYSNNEDYIFARELKNNRINIFFSRTAIVFWNPRDNAREAFNMFYRFAKGDAESGIIRPKVLLIFIRYLLGIIFFIYFLVYSDLKFLVLVNVLLLAYCFWALLKNRRYVKRKTAYFYLVLFQFLSDLAILSGSIIGLQQRLVKRG